MTGGLHVALLGIDGVGKSTLAEELQRRCQARDVPVTVTSWRRYIEDYPGGVSSYPVRSLRNLYVEAFRLLCAGTVSGSGDDGIGTYEDFTTGGGRAALEEAAGADMSPGGAMGAILLEIAGNVVFHRDVVGELTSKGMVVIDESYGYKHAVKDLLVAERAASTPVPELELIRPFVRQFFGRAMVPDVGLYLAGDPDLAMRRIAGQRRRVGRFEMLPVSQSSARQDDSAFHEMQRECAKEFAQFAASYGWTTVATEDGTWDDNRDHVMAVVGSTKLGLLLGLAPGVPEEQGR